MCVHTPTHALTRTCSTETVNARDTVTPTCRTERGRPVSGRTVPGVEVAEGSLAPPSRSLPLQQQGRSAMWPCWALSLVGAPRASPSLSPPYGPRTSNQSAPKWRPGPSVQPHAVLPVPAPGLGPAHRTHFLCRPLGGAPETATCSSLCPLGPGGSIGQGPTPLSCV